jgi:hypothetical protein
MTDVRAARLPCSWDAEVRTHEPYLCYIEKASLAIEVFTATLYNFMGGGSVGGCVGTSWRLFKFGEDNLRLEVEVPARETEASLGLLVAVCSALLQALPTSPRRSLAIRFAVGDAAGVREAEDLVAPLTYLAKPASFTREFVIAPAYSGFFPPSNPIVPQTVFKWRWNG